MMNDRETKFMLKVRRFHERLLPEPTAEDIERSWMGANDALHPGGWKRFPVFDRLYEAGLILRGRMTLHVAWQRGYDKHIRDESQRRANGGAP